MNSAALHDRILAAIKRAGGELRARDIIRRFRRCASEEEVMRATWRLVELRKVELNWSRRFEATK